MELDVEKQNRSRISGPKLLKYKAIASIISYLAIFIYSLLIIILALKRGNPSLLITIYYIALGLNVVQLINIVLKFLLQTTGRFSKIPYKIEMILAFAWGMLVIAEFIIACVLFVAFRFDLLLIAALQILALFFIVPYSRRLDYSINKKYNDKLNRKQAFEANVKSNKKNKKKNDDDSQNYNNTIANQEKKERKKVSAYLRTILFILLIEIAVLVVPKLPPHIDDIFSDYRVLEYVKYENNSGYKDGYYVKGVYYGKNDLIVVPKEYNGEPVVGILSGALVDNGQIGKITKVQLGEYDEKGNLSSNIEVIEKNAIKLNGLTEIDLPSSLKSMGDNSISGENITTINMYSTCYFSAQTFDMNSLTTINIKNTDVVIDASFESINANINVPDEIYNGYREEYYEKRELFDTAEKRIIIDFETNCSIYLKSMIVDSENAFLSISELKNEGEETSTFIQDTLLYNSKRNTMTGFISKPGYVFRGWYRDKDFIEEIILDENEKRITSNTTIYARWEEVRTVELDWSNYYPYGEKITIVHYIESSNTDDYIDFPRMVDNGGDVSRAGYTDLKWKYGDQVVERTPQLFGNNKSVTRIKAEWTLDLPSVNYYTQVGNDKYEGSNRSFVFDESKYFYFTAEIEHQSPDVAITCIWSKIENNQKTFIKEVTSTNKDTFNNSFHDHKDSGKYELEIKCNSRTGESISISQEYAITIEKKNLDVESFGKMPPIEYTYNGNPQEYRYTGNCPTDVRVTTYYDVNGDLSFSSTTGPINAKTEAYAVRYVFENIGKEADNYKEGILNSSITIKKKIIAPIWNQTGLIWNNDFEVVYDGLEHELIPRVDGKCGNDDVQFEMSSVKGVDAGTYIAQIAGINNSNYDYVSGVETTKIWKIVPKVLNTNWSKTEATYSTGQVDFVLNISGIIDGDLSKISQSQFDYSFDGNIKLEKTDGVKFIFSAKDANDYKVLINNFKNTNYIFNDVDTTLSIKKVKLSTTWQNMSGAYTGDNIGGILTVKGFLNGDEEKYTASDYSEYFVIQSECSQELVSNGDGEVEIKFFARNVGEYAVKLESIIKDNYEVDTTSSTLVVTKKTLSGYWLDNSLTYSGLEQYMTYRFTNLCEEDISAMSIEDFTIEYDGTRFELVKNNEEKYVDINFYGINAKEYNATIVSFDAQKFDNNYLYETQAKTSFNIEKLLLDVEWSESSLEYKGEPYTVSVTAINNAYEEDLAGLLSNLNYTGNVATNAGKYTAKITTDNPNYTTGAVNDLEWEINCKTITVSTSIVDKDNNEIDDLTYNGKWKYFKVIYSGFEGDDLLTLDEEDFTYGINDFDMTYVDSFIESNTYVSRFKAINAKSYIVSLNANRLSNYNITTDKNYITIKPLVLDVTWTYNEPVTYNGLAYEMVPTPQNLCTRDDTLVEDEVVFEISGNIYTNVGNYKAQLISVDDYNYKLAEDPTKNWSIVKKQLTSVWTTSTGNDSDIYNGLNRTITLTISGFENNEKFTTNNFNLTDNSTYNNASSGILTISYQPKDAGNYKYDVKDFDNNNYTFTNTSKEYEITKKELVIAWDNPSLVFNALHQQKVASATNLYGDDSITFNYAFSNVNESGQFSDYNENLKTINKGTYKVCITTIDGASANNYVLPEEIQETSYDIASKVLTITLSTNDVNPYNGFEQSLFTLTLTGFPKEEEAKNFGVENINELHNTEKFVQSNTTVSSCTFDYMSVNAGNFEVMVSASKNENYVFDEKTASSAIVKRIITVSWPEATSTYDGSSKDFAATINNVVGEDVVNVSYAYSGSSYLGQEISTTSMIDAGVYTLTINGVDNDNYTIVGGINLSKVFTVNRKKLYVNNDEPTLTYNGKYQGMTLSISGILERDNDLFINNPLVFAHDGVREEYDNENHKVLFSSVNVNTYNIEVISLTNSFNNSNYEIDNGSLLEVSYSIAKKEISINWTNAILYYNGQTQNITANIISDIYTNDLTDELDVINLTFTNNQAINIGSYTASITEIDNGNYKLPASVTKDWRIYKKDLTLSWNEDNVSTYDGQIHTHSLTIAGFEEADIENLAIGSFTSIAGSENITRLVKGSDYVILEFDFINADTYKYQLSAINDANYTFTSSNHSMIINKKEVSLSWDYVSPFTYNAESQAINCVVTNACTRVDTGQVDVVNLTLANNNKTNSGKYTASVTALSNNNYKLPNDATLTQIWEIKKVVLTTSWSEVDDINDYDGQNHVLYLTIDGFVDSEEDNVVSGNLKTNAQFNLTKEAGLVKIGFSWKDAKEYNFALTSIEYGNYEVVATEKEFVVNKIKLTVEWSGDDFTYDATEHSIKAYLKGFIADEEKTVPLSNVDYVALASDIPSFQVAPIYTNENGMVILDFHIKYGSEYSLTITGYNGNYELDMNTNNIKVTKKALSVDWLTANSYTYSGLSQGYTLIITGVEDDDLASFGNDIVSVGLSPTKSVNNLEKTVICEYFSVNAGSYEFSAECRSINYSFNKQEKSYTIDKKLLETSWTTSTDNWTDEYSGVNNIITLTIVGFENSELYTSNSFSVSHTAYNDNSVDGVLQIMFKPKDAGTYNYKVSKFNNNNYEFIETTKTYEITKKDLTITVDNKAITYGDSKPTYTVSYDGFVDGETKSNLSGTLGFSCEYDTSKVSKRNVGTYDITASGYVSNNYSIAYVKGTLSVDKKVLTVTAKNTSIYYGDGPTNDGVSYSGFAFSEKESVLNMEEVIFSYPDYDIENPAKRNAGAYTISIAGYASDNYSFNYINGVLTVNKKQLTITADNKEITYGEDRPTYTYVYGDFLFGETSTVLEGELIVTCSYNVGDASYRNAGNYTISLSGLTSDNYAIKFVSGILTVNKKALTITADTKEITYGDAKPSFTVSYDGFVFSDTKAKLSGSLSYTCSYVASSSSSYRHAGTYSITPKGYTSSNYKITYVPGVLIVNKRELTVTAVNKSVTYGSSASYTVNSSGFVYSENISALGGTLAFSCDYNTNDPLNRNVGEYTIVPSGYVSSDYQINYVDGTLTVTKKAITVKADNKSIYYGDDAPTYTATITGFAYTDATLDGQLAFSCNYDVLVEENRNVGNYQITPSGLTSNNYSINYTNGSLTVNKKELTVTAENKEITYGDAKPEFSVTYLGFVYEEAKSDLGGELTYTCQYNTANVSYRNAGNYTISLSGLTSDNYAIKFVSGTLTVNKKELTITAENKEIVYGENKPIFTVTYDGFAYTDTYSSLGGSLTYTCLYDTTDPNNRAVGEYTIIPRGYSSSNYTFNYIKGTLTVNKKELTVTAVNKSVTYGSSASYTVNYSGFVYSENMSALGGTLAFSCDYNTNDPLNRNVGEYTIVPSGYVSSNYDITYVPGTLTVDTKELVVSIIDTEISYGEEVLIETSIVGFAYGEDENVLGGMTNILCDYDTNTQNREAGVYDVTLDGHLTANNYHFRYVDGKLTVNKRELSAVFSSKSTEYTGLDQEITLTISNIAYNDIDVLISKINCQLDAEQVIGAKVDNNIVYTFVVHDAKVYDVVATIIEDDNYSLSPIEDKIVVNPAQLAVDKNSIASGELSFTGLLNEDVITENDYTIQLFSDKQHENEVILNNLETGIYYYVITLNNPTNYTISNGTGTLEVAS